MSSLEQLKQQHAIDGILDFSEASPGYLVAEISNPHATARIALQGAHLLTFQPSGEQPLIWLSPEAKLAEGKSVRGGVPVCWPWFGPHAEQKSWPGHGFARTVPWRLERASQLDDGRTELEFVLLGNEASREQWPHASELRQHITIGKTLRHELITSNLSDQPITIGQALHTYFQVGDLRQCHVAGLEGCDYIDKVAGMARASQQGPVRFAGEVDRIYLDTPARCEIVDPALNRRIVIEAQGSHSTVVWTPWAEKATQMGDLGPDGYLNMVCVETANAAEDVVSIAPGAQHRLIADYRLAQL
ncbi:MAG: D-hexose-6-phosphate mutarotase [Chromatiales bacterium]|nr:D-hexose-6-phosphate mutarotase [Gammaproteobacteria bacterium]MBW6476099.1 D-hexose-6-phosphate mutarotase [Chromatiales bacterium]